MSISKQQPPRLYETPGFPAWFTFGGLAIALLCLGLACLAELAKLGLSPENSPQRVVGMVEDSSRALQIFVFGMLFPLLSLSFGLLMGRLARNTAFRTQKVSFPSARLSVFGTWIPGLATFIPFLTLRKALSVRAKLTLGLEAMLWLWWLSWQLILPFLVLAYLNFSLSVEAGNRATGDTTTIEPSSAPTEAWSTPDLHAPLPYVAFFSTGLLLLLLRRAVRDLASKTGSES